MTARAELAARLTELAAEMADALEGVTPGEWRCWNGFKVTDSATMAMTRIGPDTGGGVMADKYGGNRADLYASREDAEFVATAPELMLRALDDLREAAALLVAPERPAMDREALARALASAHVEWNRAVPALAEDWFTLADLVLARLAGKGDG